MGVANSSQDEANHPYCCFLRKCCAFCGGDEEAQVVFCQHECNHLNPADCFYLLRVLHHSTWHLYREEEENHLLGWMQSEGAVQPSTLKREVESVESSLKVNEKREGRFLLYWITTTSTSTSTSFTTTFTISNVACTPAGVNLCG